jgi:tetratricopeptide (TPR) repeat protein
MLLRGYLWEYQGRYDEAEKIYQRILAFRPDFEGAALALSTVGEKTAPGAGGGKISPMDRSQLAWEILEPLVEKYPENMPLREALGLAYLKGRDYDRARIQFREIQNKDPEYPDIQQRIQEFSQNVEQELQEQQQKLMEPIYKKAQEKMQEIAKAGGYIFVFDRSALLYIDETQSTDITPECRKALGIPEDRTLESLQAELATQAAANAQ